MTFDQLNQQGYENLTADPESGTVAGYNSKTGETIALVPKASGEMVKRSYQLSRGTIEDLARLVTVLGAQARGSRAVALFESSQGGKALLNVNGELKPFMPGKEAQLGELDRAARTLDDRERIRQLAREAQLGASFRQDILGAFDTQWRIAKATSAAELVLEAYPPARELFKSGVPANVARQIQVPVSPGQVVTLQPLETSYGWLLPGNAPYFFDAPFEFAYLLSYEFGANNIRLIAPHSTPLRAQAFLEREKPKTPQEIAVLFTPHSDSTTDEAAKERAAFQVVRQRLEKLGVRVIDIGGDPAGHDRILAELRSEDLVVFDILHSDATGRMYIYNDGSVHPSEFQTAHGEKDFMTCCSIQTGATAAAVRAGADSATGTVQRLTLQDVILRLQRLADYLEKNPGSVLPSVLEQLLRIKGLLESGGPGREHGTLPMSLEWKRMSQREG